MYATVSKYLIYEESIDELDEQAWKNYLSIGIRNDTHNYIHGVPADGRDDQRTVLLTSALTQVRHLRATNPKDKIYGLFAVFSALEVPLPVPDYGKPLEKIYEEACVSIILHSKSLQILHYASSNTRAQNLPSWVTDWQDENVTLVVPPSHATEGSRISQAQLSTISPSGGQLLVRGHTIGRIIARAGNDFATLDFPYDSLPIFKEEQYNLIGKEVDPIRLLLHRLVLFREWMRVLDGVPPSPYPDEKSGDLFHELITFGSQPLDARKFNVWVDILQYPDTTYDISHGESIAEEWKEADSANAEHWTAELSQCTAVAAALLTGSPSKDGYIPNEMAELLDYTAQISANMGNRALILVHDNGIKTTVPGTAFHTATVDDIIVLLEGTDAPVVLRRKDNKWLFVGPAYVSGIMDGEAWPEGDDNGIRLQDFTLV